MQMTRDELEFSISRYIDGTLSPLEQGALEERLASDAQAREILAEYRALDEMMRSALPAPTVAWDRLAAHLSGAVALERPAVQVFSLVAWRRAAEVALAACVALVVSLGFVSYSTQPRLAQETVAISIVVGPRTEATIDTPPSVSIAIGPAPSLVNSWRYAESVVSRPSLVMIERGASSREDSDRLWR